MSSNTSAYFQRLWRLQPFLFQAVKRDFTIRYKRSALGPLWSVLNPLLMMGVLALAFGFFLRWNIPNYPLFLFSGLVVWQFCQTASIECLDQLVGSNNKALYSKVNLPKAVFPLAHTLSQFFNFTFAILAVLILSLVFGQPLTHHTLVIPISMFVILIFSIGLGFLTSLLNVFFRDMKFLVPVIFTMGFYLTPVLYSLDQVPSEYHSWFHWNPFFSMLQLVRLPIYSHAFPSPELWVSSMLWAASTFLVGFWAMKTCDARVIYYA